MPTDKEIVKLLKKARASANKTAMLLKEAGFHYDGIIVDGACKRLDEYISYKKDRAKSK